MIGHVATTIIETKKKVGYTIPQVCCADQLIPFNLSSLLRRSAKSTEEEDDVPGPEEGGLRERGLEMELVVGS